MHAFKAFSSSLPITAAKSWSTLFAFALVSTPWHAVEADTFVDIGAGMTSNSNVTRALLSRDQYSDTSVNIDLTAGRFFQLQPGRSITAFATASANRFDELSGLDNEALTLSSTYQHKFGLGAYAPTVGAALNWRHDNTSGKTRDRHITEMELTLSKRLSPAWSTRAGSAYEISEGRHDSSPYASPYSTRNDIFDFDQFSLFATVGYDFANYMALNLSYTWIDGNTVSSALAPNPRLLAISTALTLDSAVVAPPGRHQVAYTLPTRAHLLALDWSIPLGRDMSLNLGYVRQEIRARNSVEYANDQFSVSLLLAI